MGCSMHKSQLERVLTPMSRGSISTSDLAISPVYSQKEHARAFSDEYILGRSLGAGSYSEVFICVHRTTGQHRAAKFYRMKMHALTKGSQEALAAEINIMLSLKHPNLLETIEFFQDSRSIVLITELCHGGTLADRLVSHQRFTENTTAFIMKQLCFAVKNLHQHKIAVRSITPETILFRTREVDSKLKIIGLSNAVKFDRGECMTEVVGPLTYMSPEMLTGSYTELCDEWSLGVIMYIMLSGIPPFEANRPDAVAARIKNRDFSTTKGIWPRLSTEAKELVNLLLAPEHKRISADTALYHSWIHKNINPSEPETPVQDEVKVIPMDKLEESVQSAVKLQPFEATPTSDLQKLKAALARKDRMETGNILMEDLMRIVGEEDFALLNREDMEHAIVIVGTDSAGYVKYDKVVRELEERKHVFSRQSYASEAFLVSEEVRSKTENNLDSMQVVDASTHGERITKTMTQPFIQ